MRFIHTLVLIEEGEKSTDVSLDKLGSTLKGLLIMTTDNIDTTQQAEVVAPIATPEHQLSIETCVKAVNQSLLLGRKSLQAELAVCVSIFAWAKNTDVETKRVVSEIYCKAGYDCSDSKGKHYKTVNRRVTATAALYETLGAEQVEVWIEGQNEQRMIEAVLRGLEDYKFYSMDDVMEFSGMRTNRQRKEEADALEVADKVEDAKKLDKPVYRFTVGRAHVELPQTMTSLELLKLASKIMVTARRKEQEEIKANQLNIQGVKPAVEVARPAVH